MRLTKVKYVKHPVSNETKLELNRQGYRVLDARFDPNPTKELEQASLKENARNKPKSDK